MITIMVPAYNEQDVIEIFYNELIKIINNIEEKFEILFVNDGSKDNTLEVIKKLKQKDDRICYIDLSRNFGKEIAMMAGFDHAKGDAVITIDADLQDPPELIIQMITEWKNGYDDVYAKRIKREGESLFKKLTSYMFYRILNNMSYKVKMQIDTGDYRLLSRKAIEALKQIRETHRYTKGIYSLIGFKKKEILFNRNYRAKGKSKFNYSKLTELAIDGITSFSTAPLRIATYIGICTSMFSFLYIILIVYKKIAFGEVVQGYPSMMVIILFLGGVQLLSLGIIGEYIGRIFNETKNRPLYFINEYSKNN